MVVEFEDDLEDSLNGGSLAQKNTIVLRIKELFETTIIKLVHFQVQIFNLQPKMLLQKLRDQQ